MKGLDKKPLAIDDPPCSTGHETYLEKIAREAAESDPVDFPDHETNPIGWDIARLMELNPTAGLYWSAADLDALDDNEKKSILEDFTRIARLIHKHYPKEVSDVRTLEMATQELKDLEASREEFSSHSFETHKGRLTPYAQRHYALKDEIQFLSALRLLAKADTFDSDVLQEDYPTELLDSELKELGIDPIGLEKRGRLLAQQLLDTDKKNQED